MFTIRNRQSSAMTEWVHSFSRDFQPEAYSRFEPRERTPTPEPAQPLRADDTILPVDDNRLCEHARTRIAPAAKPPAESPTDIPDHLRQVAEEVAGLAQPAAPAPAAHEAVPAAQAADPAETPFDIPVSVLRKALPGRFAKIDADRRAEDAPTLTFGDDFKFGAA